MPRHCLRPRATTTAWLAASWSSRLCNARCFIPAIGEPCPPNPAGGHAATLRASPPRPATAFPPHDVIKGAGRWPFKYSTQIVMVLVSAPPSPSWWGPSATSSSPRLLCSCFCPWATAVAMLAATAVTTAGGVLVSAPLCWRNAPRLTVRAQGRQDAGCPADPPHHCSPQSPHPATLASSPPCRGNDQWYPNISGLARCLGASEMTTGREGCKGGGVPGTLPPCPDNTVLGLYHHRRAAPDQARQ